MKRSLIAITGATALTLIAATGCGSTGGSNASNTTNKSNATKLVVAEWTNPAAIKATKQLDKKFEQLHPGVTIDLKYAPTAHGAWHTMFNTLLQAKQVDVLAQFAPGNFVPPSYMNSNLNPMLSLAKAHQLVNFKGSSFMKNFIPGVQQQAAGYQGGIYGVEMARYANTGVFYNKTLFKKYNLTVPKTWNEFVHVCEVLKQHGITPMYVAKSGGGMVFNAIMNAQFPRTDTTQLDYKLDNELWHKQTSWENPIWAKISNRYLQASKYFEPNWTGVAGSTAPGQWAASQKYGMLVDGSWDGLTIHQTNNKLDFGWFPIPGSNQLQNNKMNIAQDLTWVVPTWAPHLQIAKEYVAFLSEPQNYKLWADTVGCIPAQNIPVDLPWMNTENDYVKQGGTQIGMAIQPPKNAGPLANFVGAHNAPLQLAPIGQYSVAELQKKATQQFQASLP